MNSRERIEMAKAALIQATAETNRIIKEVQSACKHPIILRRPSGVSGYQYIENSWFPDVLVCVDCGLVEEKDRMTPIYNTYPTKERRLSGDPLAEINERKLGQLRVNLFYEAPCMEAQSRTET